MGEIKTPLPIFELVELVFLDRANKIRKLILSTGDFLGEIKTPLPIFELGASRRLAINIFEESADVELPHWPWHW